MVLVRKVALWGLPAVEAHDVLHMVGVGEHVDGLHGGDAVGRIEKGQIACLRCGVAADVDDTLGRGAQYDLDDAGVDTRTRRVEDHDVGVAVTGDEVVVEHILHVAGIEARIAYAVCLGVEARILDGLGDILHAYDRACGRGAEVGYGARAGIEVVEGLGAGQGGEAARNLV